MTTYKYGLTCPEIEALDSLAPARLTSVKIKQALAAASFLVSRDGDYNEGARLQVAQRAMYVVGAALKRSKR